MAWPLLAASARQRNRPLLAPDRPLPRRRAILTGQRQTVLHRRFRIDGPGGPP